MEISSPRSSQCRPRVLLTTCSRCACEPRNRRGNHASGTPSVRPSDNSIQKLSSSNRTLLALTKELIPGPQDKTSAMRDDLNQFAQVLALKPSLYATITSGNSQNLASTPSFSA